MRPRIARAQKPQPVIGFLGSQAAAPPRTDPQTIALHQGFLDYGLIQDRDFIFEQRFTAGDDERFPEFARDLARLNARMILPRMSLRSSGLAALGNSSISKASIQFNRFL